MKWKIKFQTKYIIKNIIWYIINLLLKYLVLTDCKWMTYDVCNIAIHWKTQFFEFIRQTNLKFCKLKKKPKYMQN